MAALDGMPAFKQKHIADTFRQAEALGIDVLCGIYHGDHRELSAHQDQWPFDIVNYMDLIGESMGLDRPDLFKRLKLMQDADAILAETRDLIDAHGLDAEEARETIVRDLLADQHLPLDRDQHPA